jgi:hypothetical protein
MYFWVDRLSIRDDEEASRRGHQLWVLSMIYIKTTTLICLDLQLVHHFIEDTGIVTTDVNATTFLVLLVSVKSNCSTLCVTAMPKLKSKSHYDRHSVGQFVLVSGSHLGPGTNFFFCSSSGCCPQLS